MKEALICFVIALVIGSIINSTKQLDVWGTTTASGVQAATAVPAVTESTFQHEVLEADQPVLVDFYSEECVPCQKMVPIVADIANQLKGDVKVLRMDVDANASIAEKYDVHSWPHFCLFKNGEKIADSVGAQSKDELLGFIKHGSTAEKSPTASEEQNQTQIPQQKNNEG